MASESFSRKEPSGLRLDSPVSSLPRCTSADARRLERLGLRTVHDLLLHLPFGWEDFGEGVMISELRPGERATVVGTVANIAAKRTPRQRRMLAEARLVDGEGATLKVCWFDQPYPSRSLARSPRSRIPGA